MNGKVHDVRFNYRGACEWGTKGGEQLSKYLSLIGVVLDFNGGVHASDGKTMYSDLGGLLHTFVIQIENLEKRVNELEAERKTHIQRLMAETAKLETEMVVKAEYEIFKAQLAEQAKAEEPKDWIVIFKSYSDYSDKKWKRSSNYKTRDIYSQNEAVSRAAIEQSEMGSGYIYTAVPYVEGQYVQPIYS